MTSASFVKKVKQTPEKQQLEVFCKKAVLKNFAKFLGKYLCQSLFSNKAVGLRPAALLKKMFRHTRVFLRIHMCFPKNFVKFLRTLFLKNISVGLLLKPL